MKKIIAVIGVIVVAAAAYFGFNYYQSTYASKPAYGIVPAQTPEKTVTKDANGKDVKNSYSYIYEIKFAFEDGTTTTRTVEVEAENPKPLKPNSYIEVKLSKKRVTNGPSYVKENDIPKKALDALK